MGGFSKLQLSSMFVLAILYLIGLAYCEWLEQQPVPQVDQGAVVRFKHVADSLNKIEEHAPKQNKRVKSVKKLTRKIDINSATEQDLILLPGIGQVLAGRIIRFREKNGRFHKESDIKKVKGIGEKKFLLIKENIILH